jgi:predicted dehydrogenase
MSSEIRVAVLGCGSIGRRHARNAQGLAGAQVGCYDTALDTATVLAAEVGGVAHSRLEDVWSWHPQVVIIAAPSDLHIALASEAIGHGCDVFVEKPLSHSLDGVDALCAAAAEADAVTMVGCNMRFHPGPAAVKRLIDAGEIGTVLSSRVQTGSYLPRWRPGSDYHQSYSASAEAGGAVLDCIHEIDLALWYHGPARLLAAAIRPAASLGLGTDGLAELLLEHDSGVLSSVHLNFVQRDYRRSCQIIGDRGTIYWDFVEGPVRVFGEDGVERVDAVQPESWDVNDMFVDELYHFIDCVRDRKPTTNPLEGGADALRIAVAARRPQQALSP